MYKVTPYLHKAQLFLNYFALLDTPTFGQYMIITLFVTTYHCMCERSIRIKTRARHVTKKAQSTQALNLETPSNLLIEISLEKT